MASFKQFLEKYSWLIPLSLALIFVLLTLPGITWGIPDGWNPDELIQRVLKALDGKWVFDEQNFDYPSLPKYVMYWQGRVLMQNGFGESEVMWAARASSVGIGSGLIIMAFFIARKLGVGLPGSTLASLIVMSNSELAQHARYAHNDIYLAFFVSLVVWASISIIKSENRLWFYLSTFIVGLAASSKYNGGALLLLPLSLLLLKSGKDMLKEKLRSLESLGIGLLLSFFGFALGTPKALFWMTFYFKRLIPALQSHASYGYRPGRLRGIAGQWEVLPDVFGDLMFALAVFSFIFLLISAWNAWKEKRYQSAWLHLILPIAWLSYDMPIMFSYNYPERFFLPMLPLFAVMIALFIEYLWKELNERGTFVLKIASAVALSGLIAYSFARVASISLLFQNDARSSASQFLASLPPADSVEYTLYPPTIDRSKFERAHNYPIFFVKTPGGEVPQGKIYDFNTGAAGIIERQTQYLVFDSFTYQRFDDDYTCELNHADCGFFRDLLDGFTDYQEIASFEFDLPSWLPQMSISFVNPDIKIFEKFSYYE